MSQYDNQYATASSRTQHGAVVDEGLRSFMLRVYNYMALGVAGTAVVTLLLVNSPALMQTIAMGPMKWVLFIAVLGLGWFSPRIIMSGSVATGHIAYWAYCALWGMLISPMIFYFLAGGKGMLIVQALAITAATFGGLSLWGYTTKRDMSGWGGFLSMASIGVIIAMVVSFFIISDPGTGKMVSFLISCGVVLLFSAVTAYETQQIKSTYIELASTGNQEMIDRSAVFGSFMLYGSFITLFIHILNIIGFLNSD